jgi:chaperone LolA
MATPIRRSRIALAVVAVLAAVSAPAFANGPNSGEPVALAEDCASQAVRRVQHYYVSVRDLSAEFAQTTRSVALGTGAAAATQEMRGEVVFAKPGRMRWHYTAPVESLVVSDGEILWIYDPASREAQKLPVTQEYLSGAALQFLVGEGDLEAEFAVSSADCSADPLRLELVPRKEASYERLALVVDRDSGSVQATEIVDLFGNVTTIRFSSVQMNTDPPASRFGFSPPEGVRVTDLLFP